MGAADTVLVDRAHMARELALEAVLFYPKAIVQQGRRQGTPVWAAIHRFESVPASARAARAEANDIAGLVHDGVSGLVLTSDTAQGARPLDAVDRVMRAMTSLERSTLRLPLAPVS